LRLSFFFFLAKNKYIEAAQVDWFALMLKSLETACQLGVLHRFLMGTQDMVWIQLFLKGADILPAQIGLHFGADCTP
jgi:hypothetical protein